MHPSTGSTRINYLLGAPNTKLISREKPDEFVLPRRNAEELFIFQKGIQVSDLT